MGCPGDPDPAPGGILFTLAVKAHGKNVSFYVRPGGLVLAPAYDLVCVAAYPQLDQTLAMAIGDQFDGDALGQGDWVQMAVDCDLPRALVLREVAGMARRVSRALARVGEGLAVTDEEHGRLAALRAIVAKRAELLRVGSEGGRH